MLREELQDQLQNLGSDCASTSCPSGACSGGVTPADEQNNIVYCPKRTCPLSRSGSDETLSSRASSPSQAHRSVPSQMRVAQYGPSTGTVRRLSTKNCRNSPATHTFASPRSPRSVYTTAVSSSPLSTLTEGRTKSRSPSSSPTSKRLIGPYPQITWRYYEVSDPEVRRRSI